MINRRYDEGIAVSTARRSSSTRSLCSARSELGINLMRLGQDDEASKQLEDLLQQRLPGHGHRSTR